MYRHFAALHSGFYVVIPTKAGMERSEMTKGFHPVTARDDDVEIVKRDRFIGICNVQKTHIAFLGEFTLFKSVVDMPPDNGSVTSKQFRHLYLRQPNGLPLARRFWAAYDLLTSPLKSLKMPPFL